MITLKDHILTGILLAVPFPACSMVAGYLLRYQTLILNKPALPYLVAIALNIVAMRILSRKESVKIVRGMMIATFAFMLLIFLFKIHPFR
jgi:hypothetical protein